MYISTNSQTLPVFWWISGKFQWPHSTAQQLKSALKPKIEKWVMKPMNVMIGIAMTLIVLNWQQRLNPTQGFESQLQKRSRLTGAYRQRPYTWEERENNILGNYNGWSHEVWIYEGRPVMMRHDCRGPLGPLLMDGFTVSLLFLINKTHTVCRCRRNGAEKMRGWLTT